jgi:hypothetical protein
MRIAGEFSIQFYQGFQTFMKLKERLILLNTGFTEVVYFFCYDFRGNRYNFCKTIGIYLKGFNQDYTSLRCPSAGSLNEEMVMGKLDKNKDKHKFSVLNKQIISLFKVV